MDYYLKKYAISDCFVVAKNLSPEEISRIGINPYLVVRRCRKCFEKIYTGPNCRSCGGMYHLICAKISKTCCGRAILPATDFLIKFNCNKCDQVVQYGPQCVKCKRMFHNNCLEPFDKCCKINIFNFQERDCRTCFRYVEIGPKCPSCGSLYHTHCITNSFRCCNVPFVDDENAYYNCSKCTTRVVTYGPMCFICGKMVHKRCMDYYPQCCGQLLGKDVYFVPHLHFDSQGRYNKGRKRVQQPSPLYDAKPPEVGECFEKPVSVCGNSQQENGNHSSENRELFSLKENLNSLLFDITAVTKEMLPMITTMKQENGVAPITATADCSEDRSSSNAANVKNITCEIVHVKTELASPNNSICSLQAENQYSQDMDWPCEERFSDSDMEADPPILQVETIEYEDNTYTGDKTLNSEPPVLETQYNIEDKTVNSEPPVLETQYHIEIKNQTDEKVPAAAKAISRKSTVKKPPSRQQPKRTSSLKEKGSKCINVVSDILVVPGSLKSEQSLYTSDLKVNPAQMISKKHAKRKCTKKENVKSKKTPKGQKIPIKKEKISRNSDSQLIKSGKNAPTTRVKNNTRRKSQGGKSSLNDVNKESLPLYTREFPSAERSNTASPSTSCTGSEAVFQILNENSEDSLQNFFYYLYSTVKKFPRNVQIQTKTELFKTVIEAELKLN